MNHKHERHFKIRKLFAPREIRDDIYEIFDAANVWETVLKASRVEERIKGRIEVTTPLEIHGSRVHGAMTILLKSIYELSTKFHLLEEGLSKVKTEKKTDEIFEEHDELKSALANYQNLKDQLLAEAEKIRKEDFRFHLVLSISVAALLVSLVALLRT